MDNYQLSYKADHDLSLHYEYGILNFSITQARNYLVGFHNCFSDLAENPYKGRSADELLTGLRRYNYKNHVIFYQIENTTIFIVRVLRQEMDFQKHL